MDDKRDASEVATKVVNWHRELPPLAAEPMGEHTIEATSLRVPATIAQRDALWRVCHDDLMVEATMRLEQEVARLGGRYAHVFDEAIDSRRDDAKGERWLDGRFNYVLYRPGPSDSRLPEHHDGAHSDSS
jgi:hypothetical protein